MIVSEAMTEDPFFVNVEQTVGDAVAALIKSHVRHLPVLEAGVVVGIISDHDFQSSGVPTELQQLLADAPRLQALLNQPVSKLMTREAITLTPDRDLSDAIDLIVQHRIGAIPIVDPESNKLVGIVSYVDALRALRSAAWG